MICVVGNIVRDAKTRMIEVTRDNKKSSTMVTDVVIAENRLTRGADGKTTSKAVFYRIPLWREFGANMAQYLTKGRAIMVEGDVDARPWINNQGAAQAQLEIHNAKIKFINAPSGKTVVTEAADVDAEAAADAAEALEAVDVAEVPFGEPVTAE